CRAALGGSPEPQTPSRPGQLQPPRNHHAPAKSRCLVYLHYRAGAWRARHLRFRTSRSRYSAAVFLDGTNGRSAIHSSARAICSALVRFTRNLVPKGNRVLANAFRARHSRDRDTHADELSAGRGRARSVRYGNARSSWNAGDVHLLYGRSGGVVAFGSGWPNYKNRRAERPGAAPGGRPPEFIAPRSSAL